MQAMAAALGGTQSLHTNGYDEALALPTENAATLALRTQQVLAYETGMANVIDPLAGSHYVESLTTELENRAAELIAEIDAAGGSEKAVAAGFFQERIARSAYESQMRLEAGETVIVGVNKFLDGSEPPPIPAPDYSSLEREQKERVAAVREKRTAGDVENALAALNRAAARGTGHKAAAGMMPLIISAVKARATVGEISSALESEWGRYQPSI